MPGTWKEVVRLRFKGERFRDRALDLTALTELRQFQKIVAETAKALWRAAHPERDRLPAHFEDRTRLCLRRIEEGSAVTPLEVWVEDEGEGEFWETGPKELQDAVILARDVFDRLDKNLPLPERFPKELVSEYGEWGRTLGVDEEVEFEPAGGEFGSARLNGRTRERLARFVHQEVDASARPIEDVLPDLASRVPEGDWARLPDDLTDNLDHYLYGTPKR